jgi:hypothetical protein
LLGKRGNVATIEPTADLAAAIARGWAGPSLLAMILFEKFGQHQPLNRQAERYAKEGVPISLSTLADQVGGCTVALTLCSSASRRTSSIPPPNHRGIISSVAFSHSLSQQQTSVIRQRSQNSVVGRAPLLPAAPP